MRKRYYQMLFQRQGCQNLVPLAHNLPRKTRKRKRMTKRLDIKKGLSTKHRKESMSKLNYRDASRKTARRESKRDSTTNASWKKRDSKDSMMSDAKEKTNAKSAEKKLSKERKRLIKPVERLSLSMLVLMREQSMIREPTTQIASWISTQA